MGVGACFKRTTLTDYFGAEAAAEYHKAKLEDGEDAGLVIENNIGVFDPAKIRHETKTFNNVKVRWCAGRSILCHADPLTSGRGGTGGVLKGVPTVGGRAASHR